MRGKFDLYSQLKDGFYSRHTLNLHHTIVTDVDTDKDIAISDFIDAWRGGNIVPFNEPPLVHFRDKNDQTYKAELAPWHLYYFDVSNACWTPDLQMSREEFVQKVISGEMIREDRLELPEIFTRVDTGTILYVWGKTGWERCGSTMNEVMVDAPDLDTLGYLVKPDKIPKELFYTDLFGGVMRLHFRRGFCLYSRVSHGAWKPCNFSKEYFEKAVLDGQYKFAGYGEPEEKVEPRDHILIYVGADSVLKIERVGKQEVLQNLNSNFYGCRLTFVETTPLNPRQAILIKGDVVVLKSSIVYAF